MPVKVLFCSLLLCIALASLVRADTISSPIYPSKENTLIQTTSSSGQLSNALGDISVGRTNQAVGTSIRRGLVEFDIAGNIPSGATITGGTLTMTDIQGNNGNQTLSLYETLQDWGQGTSYFNGAQGAAATNGDATWYYSFYNSNLALSTSWAAPGGNYSLTLSGSAVDVATPGYQIAWSSASNPQMVSDLQAWLDDPAANFGWTIVGNESTNKTAKQLDGMFEASNLKPALSISYAVPEPPSVWLAMSGLLAVAVVRRRRLEKRLPVCIPASKLM